MATMKAWDGLAVAVSRDRVLLGPEAASLMLTLIGAAERTARRDGIGLSPALTEIRLVLATVAEATRGPNRACCGTAEFPRSGDLPEWDQPSGGLGEIGTAEVAQMLGLGSRRVRQLAGQGQLGKVRKAKGSLRIQVAEVAAYDVRRQTA